jgi:hypothetical protein
MERHLRVTRRLVSRGLAAASLLLALGATGSAQQTTGVPGSPEATTTIPGNQLPGPAPVSWRGEGLGSGRLV